MRTRLITVLVCFCCAPRHGICTSNKSAHKSKCEGDIVKGEKEKQKYTPQFSALSTSSDWNSGVVAVRQVGDSQSVQSQTTGQVLRYVTLQKEKPSSPPQQPRPSSPQTTEPLVSTMVPSHQPHVSPAPRQSAQSEKPKHESLTFVVFRNAETKLDEFVDAPNAGEKSQLSFQSLHCCILYTLFK